MEKYHALFIINPNKEQSIKEVVEGIKKSLAKTNATLEKEENWGKQQLAYAIGKEKEGLYYKLDFSVEPSKIKELNTDYKLNQDILRVMITKE